MALPVLAEETPTSTRGEHHVHRNVVTLTLTIFMVALGESLWKDFLPRYLTALGASVLAVALFQATKDFLDAIYQYPGGQVADLYGRKRALLLFSAMAMVGYTIYYLSPSWPLVFAGLFFVMAFSSLFQPAIFATIGDSLPAGKRATGFSLESILRRVPLLLGPAAGGFVILHLQGIHGLDEGLLQGVRAGLLVSIFLTAMALLIQYVSYTPAMGATAGADPTRASLFAEMREIFRAMPPSLRGLLISDSLVRFGENTAKILIILLATEPPPVGLGIDAFRFGLLVTIQMATAILSYLPPTRLAHLYGRRPFTAATFLFFSLFPLLLFLSQDYYWLLGAFVAAGLRELGEPTRKGTIVDLSPEGSRARAVGIYYTFRGLLIFPAGLVGGLLWILWPRLPFLVSFLVAFGGFVFFLLGTRRDYPRGRPGE